MMSDTISPQSRGFTTAQVEEALKFWPNLRLGRSGAQTKAPLAREDADNEVGAAGQERVDEERRATTRSEPS